MKTTIDISDNLFQKAKEIAKKNKSSFKEIVETALRYFFESQLRKEKTFILKAHTFKGQGLQDGLSEGDWSSIRSKIYNGKGG